MLYPSFGTPYLPDLGGALGSLDLALNSTGGEDSSHGTVRGLVGYSGQSSGPGQERGIGAWVSPILQMRKTEAQIADAQHCTAVLPSVSPSVWPGIRASLVVS